MIDTNLYIHEDDRKALAALKAVPGFDLFMKKLMSVFSEKRFRLMNLSSHLRVGDDQLSKYKAMLQPICERLGVKEPELYIELNPSPNAYTYGDTDPFITITTGLIDTLPEYLMPAVLAHEVGHIACHHTLYHTLGDFVLSSVIQMIDLPSIAIVPIQTAFFYWMRCSEYSADRAACVALGRGDLMMEVCARLAGYHKDFDQPLNMEAFLNQAKDYQDLVESDGMNKMFDMMMLSRESHPYLTIRADKIHQWVKSDLFKVMVQYVDQIEKNIPITWIPLENQGAYMLGMPIDEAYESFKKMGFNQVHIHRLEENGNRTLCRIDIDAPQSNWYPVSTKITLYYQEPLSTLELQNLHPGEILLTQSHTKYIGLAYPIVEKEFIEMGFTDIELHPKKMVKKTFLDRDGACIAVHINHQPQFKKDTWVSKSSHIDIIYKSVK